MEIWSSERLQEKNYEIRQRHTQRFLVMRDRGTNMAKAVACQPFSGQQQSYTTGVKMESCLLFTFIVESSSHNLEECSCSSGSHFEVICLGQRCAGGRQCKRCIAPSLYRSETGQSMTCVPTRLNVLGVIRCDRGNFLQDVPLPCGIEQLLAQQSPSDSDSTWHYNDVVSFASKSGERSFIDGLDTIIQVISILHGTSYCGETSCAH
mmetsp:Transcript_5975/g.17999  ORF Transcript_5975/g.17999 Transcript_5975/m.17999 type:complete len:207 (+) Transcript_5975:935-1555(+)